MGRLVAIGVLGIAVGVAIVAVFLHGNSGAADTGGSPVQKPVPSNDASAPDQEDSRPSLAAIAALADDFERNAALYRLVSNANTADIERLLAEFVSLSPVHHRYDIARVLYIRFAAIDPAAAVEHVVNVDYHASWIAAVFRVWAHQNLDAAVAKAATLRDDPKAIATRTILELDLPAWQREAIADQLVDRTMWETIAALGEISARAAARGGHRDFVSEAEAALLTPDTTERSWRVAHLARAWVGEDPAAALAWAEGVTNPWMVRRVQTAFTEVLVAQDPTMALDLLARTDGIWDNPNTVHIVMRGLLKVDFEAAIRSLDVIPPRVQMSARRALLSAVHHDQASDFGIESVANWYASLESPIRAPLASDYAFALAAHDSKKAFTWALDVEGDEARRSALGNVMYHLGTEDRAAGNRLLAQIEDPEDRKNAAVSFVRAYAQDDPQGGWRWAKSFSLEEYRPHLLSAVLSGWLSRSPEQATRTLLAMPRDLRDRTAARIGTYTIARHVGPERAEEIFNAVESRDARIRLAEGLVRYYRETEPDADGAEYYRSIVREPVP